jgi:hypothetical protein
MQTMANDAERDRFEIGPGNVLESLFLITAPPPNARWDQSFSQTRALRQNLSRRL